MIHRRHPGLLALAWILGLCCTGLARAAVPPALGEALKSFRSDPPPGWTFNQTTVAEGKSTIERCDGAQPEFNRWTLVQKDGRAPTADELREYAVTRSQRSRSGTAPKIIEQFDLGTLEVIADTPAEATYRCRLRPGDGRDRTAPALRATIALHKPSGTITSIALGTSGEFSPTFGVRIGAMKTTMTYRLPTADTPSLPQKVETHVRGRAFLFKSLDADMTVTFSDYVNTRAKNDQGRGTKPGSFR